MNDEELRDQFATAALIGLLSDGTALDLDRIRSGLPVLSPRECAKRAFDYADAMIAARDALKPK